MTNALSPRSSTARTSVYAFDLHTGKLSFAARRLSPRSDSYSASSETHVFTSAPQTSNSRMPDLGEGSPRIIEEISIRDGQTVYFVARLDSGSLPSQGFVDVSDTTSLSAKQHNIEMERLVWQLEAALAEDGSPESDYEGDIEEFEDEFLEFSDYESDDRGIVDFDGATLATDYLPESDVHEDSIPASDRDANEGPAWSEVSSSQSSDSSSDSVTFDPPSSSASSTEELAPSMLSPIHSASSQTAPLSSSALLSASYSAIEEHSMPSRPEFICGDASVFLETPSGRNGRGCPPTEEEPFCPACYGAPIRLLWGDEPSNESLSDLVDELLGDDDDLLLDEAAAPAATHPFVDVDIPIDPPIVAADWSLSQALASQCEDIELETAGATSGVGSSTSMSSLFSERPVAPRAGSDDESESLDKVLERVRKTRGAEDGTPSQTTPQVSLRANRSAEVPSSSLRALRGEKKTQHRPKPCYPKPRRRPETHRSSPTLASSNVSAQQEPRARPRKHARDEEKEEGEISEHEPESDPDIPLSEVIASRGRTQSTLGHGPPPPKRMRLTSVAEPRRVSRDNGRSRRSWAHRRWEERLMQRHARASHEGRRCMRVTSTDEEQLRRGIYAASGPR